jgi:hypothetical protein
MIEPIASRPLDDGIWRAWQNKNRDQDARGLALRMKVGKWLLLVVLPAALLLWFFLDRVL